MKKYDPNLIYAWAKRERTYHHFRETGKWKGSMLGNTEECPLCLVMRESCPRCLLGPDLYGCTRVPGRPTGPVVASRNYSTVRELVWWSLNGFPCELTRSEKAAITRRVNGLNRVIKAKLRRTGQLGVLASMREKAEVENVYA